jgi:hypothetical protein
MAGGMSRRGGLDPTFSRQARVLTSSRAPAFRDNLSSTTGLNSNFYGADMCDLSVRAILLVQHKRIMASHRAVADLQEAVLSTQLAILETQDLIRRSDQLIHTISKKFGGVPSEAESSDAKPGAAE